MSMRHGPNIKIAFFGLKRNNGHSMDTKMEACPIWVRTCSYAINVSPLIICARQMGNKYL